MASSYNVSPNISDSASGLIPVGTIHMWPTFTPPTDYLICDGSFVSRTDYSALFNVIGVFYGNGNGTTSFTLPNASGRTVRGTGIGFGLGQRTGTDNVNLLLTDLPLHSHIVTDPGHQHPAVFQGQGFASSPGGFGNTASFPGTTEFAQTGITILPSLVDGTGVPVPQNNRTLVNVTNPMLVLNYIIRAI